METSLPIAIRNSTGLSLSQGPPSYENLSEFPSISSKTCKTLLFSSDGKYFAYVDGTCLKIFDTTNWQITGSIENTKASHLAFSPKGTFLMSWEQYIISKNQAPGKTNLNIYKTENGEFVAGFVHKKLFNWEPQWSSDEKICSRLINNDIAFHEDLNLDLIVTRLNSVKVATYTLSPTVGTYYVLCHIPGKSGQPSFAKMFKYSNFDAQQSVASKSFFQADKVEFYWNCKGNCALLLTSTEVDKTGGSYYGKQGLHFMSTSGETAMITMSKEGPIYNVAWSPKSQEFCVIYGFMPAKTTIFNVKCDPIFEFGSGAWNSIYYNPQGNLILLGGFGNLRGNVEVWNADTRKKIGTCEAPDSTLLHWAPDGIHFLTATTAPRLRIGNGYKIWHYSGALLHEKLMIGQEELYDICWKNYPKETFKEPTVSLKKVEGITSSQPLASKQVYRPPSARNRAPNLLDNDNTKPTSADVHSKVSKQKKKRDAKKAQRLVEGVNNDSSGSKFVSNIQITPTGNEEKDKKLKNLKKKLDAIEKLKEQQAEGKTLEKNQLAKLETEDELVKEFAQLQLQP